MQPHTYTEVFFLDEATSFSAGHRPCCECRRADYQRFRALWEHVYGAPVNADVMDVQLRRERIAGRKKRTYRADIVTLPDGTFIALEGMAWLVWGGTIHAWSDSGYRERRPRPRQLDVDVLTPPSSVAIFRAGYRPGVHPSAE
jgi:hypothetical protein